MSENEPKTRKRSFLLRCFQPRVLICLAAIVSAVVFVPQLMRMAPDLKNRPEYIVELKDIHVTQPPAWVPIGFIDEALAAAKLQTPFSLLDKELAARLAGAFEKHPWVEKVRLVEKQFPARIFIDLDYRKPVAMVRVGNGFYPVDRQGILLPPEDFSMDAPDAFPVIGSVLSVPGPAGTLWDDPAVIGAAELATILHDSTPEERSYWAEFDLQEIRVPRRHSSTQSANDLVFELLTPGGSSIIWGRAPSNDHPGELSADQKLGRLKKYVASFGSFDDRHGPYELDIRHWQDISRRALAVEPARPRF